MSRLRVAAILPLREKFGPTVAGAVALTIRDLAYSSASHTDTTVFGHSQTSTFKGIEFIPIKQNKFRLLSRSNTYIKSCIKALKITNFDIVEVHNRVSAALEIKKKLPHIKVVLYLHNDPITMRGLKTEQERRSVVSILDSIICVSEFVKSRFSSENTNIHTIFNALTNLPIKISIEQKKPIISYIGRVVPEKGTLMLADSLAKVLPLHPSWKCIFIGAAFFGSTKPTTDYEQKVVSTLSKLGDSVIYMNSQPNDVVMKLQYEASISVIPSLWEEPFGRTLLEAMASGCACISTKRGGIPEVAGENAILLEPITSDILASALNKLIEDKSSRIKLQCSAKAYAETHFNIEAQSLTLFKIRTNLLKVKINPITKI